MTTATTLGQEKGNFLGGVGLADATSVIGVFSYGLSRYTDGRLKLGLVDADNSDTKITLGADFKWQFWQVGQGRREPFDMAFGGFFEYMDLGAASVFQFGGQVIGSYPMALSGGGTLSPYGRVNVRVESASFDRPANYTGDNSTTNLEFGLNGGVAWSVTRAVTLTGEFQLDGNDGIFLGIDFNIM